MLRTIQFSIFLLFLLHSTTAAYLPVPAWEDHQFMYFCPCMGRLGNQMDHYLGVMGMAIAHGRTLILPDFIVYEKDAQGKYPQHIPFEHIFDIDAIAAAKGLTVITSSDFFSEYNDDWEREVNGERTIFCYLGPNAAQDAKCNLHRGEPFQSYFSRQPMALDFKHHFALDRFSAVVKGPREELSIFGKYKVISYLGAPAAYPVERKYRHLQQHLVLHSEIQHMTEVFIKEKLNGLPFLGVHLRRGRDWQSACRNAVGRTKGYMSSPQCGFDAYSGLELPQDVCFGHNNQVVSDILAVARKHQVDRIFLATDNPGAAKELRKQIEAEGGYPSGHVVMVTSEWLSSHPQEFRGSLSHVLTPLDPLLLDLGILSKSNVFLGNCVSSVTGFVTRQREVDGTAFEYFGLVEGKEKHDEL